MMKFKLNVPVEGTPFRRLDIYKQKLTQIYLEYWNSPLTLELELAELGPYKGRGKGGKYKAKSRHSQSKFTRNMRSKYSPKVEDKKHA